MQIDIPVYHNWKHDRITLAIYCLRRTGFFRIFGSGNLRYGEKCCATRQKVLLHSNARRKTASAIFPSAFEFHKGYNRIRGPIAAEEREAGSHYPFCKTTALLNSTFGLSTGMSPALRALLIVP